MKKNIKILLLLHLVLVIYSLSGILSKLAASQEFFSLNFILLYGGVLFILAIYAICWQQIIKRMTLTFAFANRAATVVWGIIWGILFFHEQITIGKIIGALFVIAGIILYAYFSREEKA